MNHHITQETAATVVEKLSEGFFIVPYKWAAALALLFFCLGYILARRRWKKKLWDWMMEDDDED